MDELLWTLFFTISVAGGVPLLYIGLDQLFGLWLDHMDEKRKR